MTDTPLVIPAEWATEPFLFTQALLRYDAPGHEARCGGGVLEDGTNLIGVIYPGGQRLARMSPDTGWALEERFTGRALDERDEHDQKVAEMWTVTLDSMIAGHRKATEQGIA